VPADPSRERRLPDLLALLVVFLLAAYALSLGQSSSWDLRNYHLYLPWAWLTGRLDRDVAAAQAQSFFNPLLQVPQLWSAMTFGPVVHTALLALVQGANVLLVYGIALRVLKQPFPERTRWCALVVAVAGGTGATALSELGSSYGDNIVSLPLLGGVLALLSAAAGAGGATPRQRPGPWSAGVAASGVLLGMAAGLKLAIAPFAAGAVLCAPLLTPGRRSRLELFARLALGAIVGFGLTAGPWMLELWERYRDPVYPAFADWFPTLEYPAVDLREAYRPPKTLLEWLAYPMVWTDHAARAGEYKFRDHRILFWYLALVFLPWWRRRPAVAADSAGTYLVAWLALSYLVSLAMFGYYRFLLPLEMLAPAATALLLARAWPSGGWRWYVLGGLFLVSAASQITPDLGHVPFGRRYLELAAPAIPERAHVVLAGDKPTAFLALALGPSHDYIRVGGNLGGARRAPWALDTRIARALDRDREPIVAVLQDEPAVVHDDLARFGLVLEPLRCTAVTTNLIPDYARRIRFCDARRARPAAAALSEARAAWTVRCEGAGAQDAGLARQCRALDASQALR
jgi:hypothetical protein